ncbi:lysosomal Pro-X carboxypeptidase isoform X1 [Camellia sinensis]|uniref:lysosomal Pro-X carboxypeptidase isoform X1 n=1 Tax=Camellia sinensis TaxID=4442 RepID=UPI0010366B29|nr:lysosomal Pro-X carboxypeptidase isoform X1 [Camellia sinensis]
MSLIQKQNHCSKNFSMNSATTLLLRSFPLFFFLIFSTPLPASPNKIPKLRTFLRDPANTISASVSEDYETFFYTQTLDHFNYRPESYATFQQKYVINFKYWGGANTSAPIFAYLGAEAPLSNDLGIIGFLSDTAPQFKALQVYIEHRYYGESVPFGTFEEALKNESIRGYFNSAQAITDYAEVLLYLKKNLSANYSPIIVVGGSYGGMLASWFRLKYPHIALGAVASSAPILYFDDITPQNGYYSIVTKDFKEASESCYETIRQSWSVIDEVASQLNGLSILSQRFKTCAKLNTSVELKNYLDSLYATAAQYNEPSTYPVTVVCGGIDGGGASQETDVLGRVFSGVVAYFGNRSCYDTNYFNDPSDETNVGFQWQICSEMVLPIGRGNNDTMFPAAPFNLSSFIEDCKNSYGVFPRPHWVTTYYGGHDIKLVLHRFASNIIFSNGLRDPYSSGGVLEDISDSVLAVSTVNGSHCLDILSAKQSDPQWLVMQRKREVKIIENWITKYYEDLLLFKK